jgi:endonuclease/exonuclease/phosphatase family metal-dependent hydrolase
MGHLRWITAATLLSSVPLLVTFLLFQRQFVQSFFACRNQMKLITWNTPWCCGLNGQDNPDRSVSEAHAMAYFDVLCMQKTASGLAWSARRSADAHASAAAGGHCAVPS